MMTIQTQQPVSPLLKWANENHLLDQMGLLQLYSIRQEVKRTHHSVYERHVAGRIPEATYLTMDAWYDTIEAQLDHFIAVAEAAAEGDVVPVPDDDEPVDFEEEWAA